MVAGIDSYFLCFTKCVLVGYWYLVLNNKYDLISYLTSDTVDFHLFFISTDQVGFYILNMFYGIDREVTAT